MGAGEPMSGWPYQAETAGFIVRVRPEYLPEQSEPDDRRWAWAYHIEIVNASSATAQLIARAWTITDANGKVETVAGPGVVGETPTLQPGDAFAYTSGCALPTASGAMVGLYVMVGATGERFEIAIPAFSLDVPGVRRVMN
jgi:ApaG protein